MKRISLLIIGLLAIVVTTLQAQVDFGVRFGVSYSALTQRIDEGYVSGGKAGFSIAGLADIPIYRSRYCLRWRLIINISITPSKFRWI